jgi:hypothetical protein
MSATPIKMGSDRSFGLVFAGVFALVALWPLLDGREVGWWGLVVAAAGVLVALIRPALLAPFNRLWFRFGLALGKVMTPVAMFVLFALAVIPTALLLRLFGKDPLQRRLSPDATSYWERREKQPGPMREQW